MKAEWRAEKKEMRDESKVDTPDAIRSEMKQRMDFVAKKPAQSAGFLFSGREYKSYCRGAK